MRNLFAVIVHRILRAWENEEEETSVEQHAKNVISRIKTQAISNSEVAAVEAAAKVAYNEGLLKSESFYMKLPLLCAIDVHRGDSTPAEALMNFNQLYPFEDDSLRDWLANTLVSYPDAADRNQREVALVKLAMETSIQLDRAYRRQALSLRAMPVDIDNAITESIKMIKDYAPPKNMDLLVATIRKRVSDLIP